VRDPFSKSNADKSSKRRIYTIVVLIAGIFLLYTVYLFNLQIVKGFVYKEKAKEVTRREIIIPAQRGEIYDRNYNLPLVENIESFAVEITPGEISNKLRNIVYDRISKLLDIKKSLILKKIPPKYYHLYQPIEIKSGIGYGKIAYLAEHIDQFPGVSWYNKPIRKYRSPKSLSHILGYVGNITNEELQILYNQGYSPGTVLGKSGIEKEYDELLRGKTGKKFKIVDVKERTLKEKHISEIDPVPGKNIVLTIDRDIQILSEKALGPRIGSVIVMKPATGEVLAMVSYPWFDSNIFSRDGSEKLYKKLSLNPASPFINRAIQSAYPPASAFKMIMTTAFIEEEPNALTTTFTCTGSFKYGDRIFHGWKKTGHGTLDLFEGLAQSCDIYFYNVGLQLGVEKITSYMRDFELGRRTGIDLPGEVSGFIPTPEWKEKVHHMKWLGGDTINMSIGQGYMTVSPIQMADIVSMIVNEGTIYKPHLLKEVRDPVSGRVLMRKEPDILHTSHINKSTFRLVQQAMRGVITRGTAHVVITTKAVESAGKTGTSQTGIKDRFHSWFAAYAPYKTDNPDDRIVVVVMVEAANKWEWWAPKAANIILQGIFAHQNFRDAVKTLNPWYIRGIRGFN